MEDKLIMRKILRRSSSLVLAGLFLLNGHCGLLSQRVLADPPTPDSLKFRGDNERTYSLCCKTQGEKSIPWIIGAGQESVAYMCKRDDGKICVAKTRGVVCFDIDAVVKILRESYKPFEVSDEKLDGPTLPRRSLEVATPCKPKVRPGDSDLSDVFLDLSEERKVSGSGEKAVSRVDTSMSRKPKVKKLSFADALEDEDKVKSSVDISREGSSSSLSSGFSPRDGSPDDDLDEFIDDFEEDEFCCVSRKGDSSSSSSFPAGARKSLPSPIGISPDDDLDELIGDDEDELYCTSSRKNSSFPAGAQKSLPIPRDKKKPSLLSRMEEIDSSDEEDASETPKRHCVKRIKASKGNSSLLSRMKEMDSSDEEDASETPKRHCVKRIKASKGNSSLLSRMEEIDSSDEKGTSEKPPKMRRVIPNFDDDYDDLSDISKVSTSVCGSSDESLSSPDSGLISKGGSPVETSSCASVNASPDIGSSSSATVVGNAVLRSAAVKYLLSEFGRDIPYLLKIESFNPQIEEYCGANLESYVETREDQKNHITKAKATENQVKMWVGNILDALVGLRNLRICHQDIKPDNILLDENGQAILGDVGAMHTLDEVNNGQTSVPCYMPPEIMNKSTFEAKKYRDRADVFALAITALELLTGSKITSPYKTIMQKILDDEYRMWDGKPLSDGWKIFLWKCLAPTPEKRLTAKQAKVVLDNLVVANRITFDDARNVLGQLVANEQEELVEIKGIFGKLFEDGRLFGVEAEAEKKALFYSFISSERLVLKDKKALYDLWFLYELYGKLTPEYRKALLNCSSDKELMLLGEIFQDLFSGKTLSINEKEFLLRHFVEHKRLMSVMEENLLKSLFLSKGIAQNQIDGLFGELHLSTTRLFDDLMKHLELDLADEQEAFDE